MDIQAIAHVALDAALEGREWEDDGTLDAVIAQMVRAQIDLEMTRDLGDLVNSVRYQITADPRQLADAQLRARVLFDMRSNAKQRLVDSLDELAQRGCLRSVWERGCEMLGWDLDVGRPTARPRNVEIKILED